MEREDAKDLTLSILVIVATLLAADCVWLHVKGARQADELGAMKAKLELHLNPPPEELAAERKRKDDEQRRQDELKCKKIAEEACKAAKEVQRKEAERLRKEVEARLKAARKAAQEAELARLREREKAAREKREALERERLRLAQEESVRKQQEEAKRTDEVVKSDLETLPQPQKKPQYDPIVRSYYQNAYNWMSNGPSNRHRVEEEYRKGRIAGGPRDEKIEEFLRRWK